MTMQHIVAAREKAREEQWHVAGEIVVEGEGGERRSGGRQLGPEDTATVQAGGLMRELRVVGMPEQVQQHDLGAAEVEAVDEMQDVVGHFNSGAVRLLPAREPDTISGNMAAPVLEPGETRTLERVRFHFEVERELADRLRQGSRAERATLYSAVYDELFRRVPDHPQLTRRRDAEALRAKVDPQVRMLRPFLTPATVYLELGAGDCAVSVAVAPIVRKVYAVDVSAEIARVENPPANFELVISDGTNIPVPGGSVDVVYSNQLMEHLHPDDALEQLRAVHACLAPGGRYICVTPNRLSGPHDISKYFEESARGFHLKEYTARELAGIFRDAGFSQVRALHGAKGRFIESAAWPLIWAEQIIGLMPAKLRRALGRQAAYRALLGIQLIGIK